MNSDKKIFSPNENKKEIGKEDLEPVSKRVLNKYTTENFVHFLIDSGVLTFGDFTTKSGRKTPYFVNTGNFNTGEQMDKLGHFYANKIIEVFGKDFNVLFGPAYKGIPLVVTTAIALKNDFNYDVKICFNRKEIKDHGEKGILVGYKPKKNDKILIIEDVTTAGTSIRETVPILKKIEGIVIKGLIVSVDRMEKGKTNISALKEIEKDFGFKTVSIVNLDNIISALYPQPYNGKRIINDEIYKKIQDYRAKYID